MYSIKPSSVSYSSLVDSSNGSKPTTQFFKKIVDSSSGRRKCEEKARLLVGFVTFLIGVDLLVLVIEHGIKWKPWEVLYAAAAGAVVLLSALIVILINPVIVSPAFATFPNAGNSGPPIAAAAGGKLIRTELLTSAWTGFFAGCLHTLSGPDH